MGENMVPTDFPTRLDFAARRHRPMEKAIETRYSDAASRRLYMFEKGRESPDNFSSVERFSDPAEFIRREARLDRARLPGRPGHLIRFELAFQSDQDFPFQLAQFRRVHSRHRSRQIRLAPGLDCFASNMPDPQGENPFGGHQSKMLGADFAGEQFAMFLQRKTTRHFHRRPELVLGSRSD